MLHQVYGVAEASFHILPLVAYGVCKGGGQSLGLA